MADTIPLRISLYVQVGDRTHFIACTRTGEGLVKYLHRNKGRVRITVHLYPDLIGVVVILEASYILDFFGDNL